MPKVLVTLPDELNNWLLDLVDNNKRARAGQIRAFLYMYKNGLVFEGNGNVRKVRVDDWKSIEEIRREKSLKKQASKDPAEMKMILVQKDIVNELQEKFKLMGLNREARATINHMRKEMVEIAKTEEMKPNVSPYEAPNPPPNV